MRRAVITAQLAVLALAGCGSAGGPPAQTAPAAGAGPELLQAPRRAGEIIVRGDATPKVAGPFSFDGTYRVRFEQYAPEDPQLDFAGETTFVADLERSQGVRAQRVFRAAAATGSRTLRLRGRYFVDASFGDYPFALRFTRVRG